VVQGILVDISGSYFRFDSADAASFIMKPEETLETVQHVCFSASTDEGLTVHKFCMVCYLVALTLVMTV
jgi:hypothetical protein